MGACRLAASSSDILEAGTPNSRAYRGAPDDLGTAVVAAFTAVGVALAVHSLGATPREDQALYPGYFRRQGSALIGDHTAEYREFALADQNGPVTGNIRVWWLPVSKVFVMSTVDAMYDKDVDHMLATFNFAGYRPPSSTVP